MSWSWVQASCSCRLLNINYWVLLCLLRRTRWWLIYPLNETKPASAVYHFRQPPSHIQQDRSRPSPAACAGRLHVVIVDEVENSFSTTLPTKGRRTLNPTILIWPSSLSLSYTMSYRWASHFDLSAVCAPSVVNMTSLTRIHIDDVTIEHTMSACPARQALYFRRTMPQHADDA